MNEVRALTRTGRTDDVVPDPCEDSLEVERGAEVEVAVGRRVVMVVVRIGVGGGSVGVVASVA